MAEATATTTKKMQLLPETLLKQEESEKYPGFSLLLVLQCPLVPLSGQTNPEASGHYNLENAIHRSYPSPHNSRGGYTEQSQRVKNGSESKTSQRWITLTLFLPFYHILFSYTTSKLPPNMVQLFFTESCSHTLLKERRHKDPSVIIFISIIHELQVICSHSHLFWMWLLIGLVTCELNCKV